MSKMFTPFGVAKWINLETGKHFQGRPKDEFDKGRYELTLTFDDASEEWQNFEEQMRRKADELFEQFKVERNSSVQKYEGKWLPFREEVDEDNVQTGRMEVNMARRAGGKTTKGKLWSARIGIFDLAGEPFVKPEDNTNDDYGRGTILRASFEPICWQIAGAELCRIRFEMRAVQIKTAQFYATQEGNDFAGMTVEEKFD